MAETGVWDNPAGAAVRKLRTWNHHVQHVRCRIENVFGTGKPNYGLRCMRWLGLGKDALQVRLTAMAYNRCRGRPTGRAGSRGAGAWCLVQVRGSREDRHGYPVSAGGAYSVALDDGARRR